ncbi:efflux RND transporter periplasmic adaptor subunit [Draconibacterium sp. IB214405]|uniref:efflux RND transporter periplasmic adaptor subunit n=1 Tax=Draconibacterium sp. IB214405 TaxID=3097352 RepID=UPI002A0FE4E1|nr:efflux RND transporter periplasmic adaptor subunit [Draconibacterium sp. IB214405]MDX8338239.1 efflux RND transporter periplasmic adaptor subunit [Draconibacterium sp. IB214405]
MSWRKTTFVVVALIVLLGGAAALSELFISMKPEQVKRPDVEIKRSVKVKTVNYSEITSPLSLPGGRAVSGSEVILVSEASGKIEPGAVVLRKGTSFKKGQLLAEIYKDEVELALKARKAGFLTVMTSLLPDMKVDFPDQLNAYETFFRAIDLDTDLPEMPVVRDEKLKIFLASQGVLTEYYGIKQDEKKLKRHTLYAPFDGTFTQVNYETGSYVNTGGQIAQMIRTDNVEIEVPVPNEDSEWIKIGDKVIIHSNLNDKTITGKVVRKSDFIEAETQSRSVFVKVNQADSDQVLPGQLYAVQFPGQKTPDAMEIPRGAVFNTNTVFIVVDGELKKRDINVIKRNETTFIINGLPEGAKVVAEPLINVKENTPVNILGEEKTNKQKPGNQAKPQ